MKYFQKKVAQTVGGVLAIATAIAVVLGGISTIKSVSSPVAVLLSSLNNPYFQAVSDGINKELTKKDYNGLTVQYYDSENSVDKESTNIANIIATGKKVVLFNDVNEASGVDSVKKLTAAGIKVVAVDHVLVYDDLVKEKDNKYNLNKQNFNVVANIASDNKQAGYILALFMKQKIGMDPSVAKTFTLYGIPGTQSGMDRVAGFQRSLDPSNPTSPNHYVLSAYNDAKADGPNVGFQADDNRTKANEQTANNFKYFTDDTKFKNIVFGTNDEAALGAISQFKNAGKLDLLAGGKKYDPAKKDVYVLGIDNTHDALEAIKQGHMTATVEQNTDLMGALSVQVASYYLGLVKKDGKTESYNDTTYGYWYTRHKDAFTIDQKEDAKVTDGYYFKLHTNLHYLDETTKKIMEVSQIGESDQLSTPKEYAFADTTAKPAQTVAELYQSYKNVVVEKNDLTY